MRTTRTEVVKPKVVATHRAYTRIVPLCFFSGMFLYIWLIIRPTLIYHAFARFIDYPEFRITGSYFITCLSRPGGLLDYIHGFFSQWLHTSWAGAAILTALAWAIHACVGSLLESSRKQRFKILPYVPAMALIAYYGRYEHGLVHFLGLLFALGATLLYKRLSSTRRLIRTLAFAVFACVLYTLSGSVCVLFTILAVVLEALCNRYPLSIILYPAIAVASVGLIGILGYGLEETQVFLLHAPFSRESVLVEKWPACEAVVMAAFMTVPLGLLLKRLKRTRVLESRQTRRHKKANKIQAMDRLRSSRFRSGAQIAGLVVATCLISGLSYDSMRKHMLYVNCLARKQMWPELLVYQTSQNLPDNEYCRHDTIRALCQTGRMADELFAHDPTRSALLLTANTSATLDPVAYSKRSELMLELGYAAIAEKNAYEQLQKMGPCPFILERLANIHLVKGNHDIARVFLNLLKQDLIYQSQARQLLDQIQGDPEMTDHPTVQQLRPRIPDHDNINYHFAEGFFLQLLDKDPLNKMAFEYMMAYNLLNGRLQQIARQIHRLKDFGHTRLPRYYEEALTLYSNTSGDKLDLGSWKPRPEMLKQFNEFAAQFQRAGGVRNKAAAQQALRNRFGDTYLYYYAFSAPKESK